MTRVLIFDSGVGGLSIMQAIKASMPHAQLIFASDNQAYPYGTKTEAELSERVQLVVTKLVEHTQADIVVIACNTASTVMLPTLRDTLDIPVVGVVPAIKPAAKLSQSKHIGVIATPATVDRAYTKELISDYASDCTVTLLGSSALVDLAETKLHTGNVDVNDMRQAVEVLFKDQALRTIDTIVLACTHFPLLRDELNQVFNNESWDIKWVDSAQGIANRVKSVSEELGLDASDENANGNIALFTKDYQQTEAFTDVLNSLEITQSNVINV